MKALQKYLIVMLAALPMTFTAFTVKAGDIVDTAASTDQFSTLVAHSRFSHPPMELSPRCPRVPSKTC